LLPKDAKNKKFILRRAKNGQRREQHVGAAMYGVEKTVLKKMAKEEARKLGYKDMSISAYINMKMLLP